MGGLDKTLDDVLADYGSFDSKGTYTTGQYELLINAIKQVFTDAGYVQIPTAEKDKAGFIHINPEGIYMTGSYWYERFEKELPSMLSILSDESASTVALEAAKRAAGIE